MTDSKSAFNALLNNQALINSLTRIQRGIEKEGLRVTGDNSVSQIDHPATIGSTLTHPSITTDYSEALLEFITPKMAEVEKTVDYLTDLHSYSLRHLNGEVVWPASMPCKLDGDESIPIAKYGVSNVGLMKHIYRQGLGVRYGRVMQSIAGIHYNFSLPDEFWLALLSSKAVEGSTETAEGSEVSPSELQNFKSDRYFSLIRNFRRYSWLLYYLFGASPVLDRSFLGGRQHKLQQFQENTFGLPYATSLRMSDLGYQNSAQESLHVSYNSLDDYTKTLAEAVYQPYADYEKLGIKRDGEYIQLNANILQLENEYYSDIRPKRVTNPGEKPICALIDRGVEYVEVRILDINPFLAEGISAQQIRFLDAFLLFCLLSECPLKSTTTCEDVKENQSNIILRGRDPELEIICDGERKPFIDAAEHLLESINTTAKLLDQANSSTKYTTAVAEQNRLVQDVNLTPSAQVMNLVNSGTEFLDIAKDQADKHKAYFVAQTPKVLDDATMQQLAEQSLHNQTELEQQDAVPFDDYLTTYNNTRSC